jgi:hypothetical protein
MAAAKGRLVHRLMKTAPVSSFHRPGTFPAHASEKKPSLLERVAAMRFVSISLIVHAIIVLFGGSVVLVKTIVQTPDFVAGDGELYTPGDASTQAPPDSLPKPQDTPQFGSASPQLTTPTLDAITAVTNSASFQIAAAPAVAKLDGKIADLPAAVGKGIGDKLAGLKGGGMRGGTKAFFGMRETKDSKAIGLVGNFYDAKQTRSRKPTNVDVNQFSALVTKFVNEGWKESVLNDYYKAPNTLYTTQIFIPNMSANEGPKAFDVDKEVQPSRWLVHYKCRISPPRSGDFRFVGAGDDYLVVRLNNKVVLDQGFAKATDWKPEKYYNYGWTGVPNGFARGDKFHAVAGQYYDMEVLISERPGGLVFFCLMVEEQDTEYRKDAKGNPILPIFRLADGPMPEPEKGQTLPPYEPNGPIWRSQPFRGGSSFSQFFGAN